MEKTVKVKYYSIIIAILVYVVMISIPFSLVFNENVSFILNIIMRVGGVIFITLYGRKEKLDNPIVSKPSLKDFIFLPLLLLPFSNIIVAKVFNYPMLEYDKIEIIKGLLTYLFVGFSEEYLFRGYLMERLKKDQKSIIKIILIQAIAFGSIHLVNISNLASIPYCLAQVGYSAFSGLIMGIMLYYSDSIIYPMIFHFLFDFINDTIASNMYDLYWDFKFIIANVIIGIIVFIYAIFIFYLVLRKEKCKDVSGTLDI